MKNVLYLMLISALLSVNVFSQKYNLEAALMTQFMSGDYSYIETDDGPKKIEVESFMTYGFEAGMNLGRFNMGCDFLFGSTNVYSVNTIEAKMTCVDIDMEYCFLKKAISPLLIVGLGSVNYNDSFTSVETLNENDVSYNVGAGIKRIIAEKYFVKPYYRLTFSQIEYTTYRMLYHGMGIGVGYIFTPKMYR